VSIPIVGFETYSLMDTRKNIEGGGQGILRSLESHVLHLHPRITRPM